MACTNITVLAASSSITITKVSFGNSDGPFTDCTVPGSNVGKPIHIGFSYSGTGIIRAIRIVISYVDYLGDTVTATQTRLAVGNTGDVVILMGRNYHSGTYKNLTVTATPII